VGPDRAGYLKIWLDKVEKACQLELNRLQKVATAQKVKIPDQLPTQKVDTERQKQIARRQGQRQQDSIIEKYTNQKRPINQHLLRLKNDYDTNTVTIRRELDKLMNDSATKQKEYKANYEKTRQQTAQFYDQKHRALKQEVVDHLMATKNELNRLKAQTRNRLQENLDHFSRQMIQQIQLAQSLLGDLTHEYAALTELEEQYQKLD
ncbi:MAG: hypothetical protein LH609_08665, partial [Rudanella sp.]|nr:hypothetical protein [Rudanella sp.]